MKDRLGAGDGIRTEPEVWHIRRLGGVIGRAANAEHSEGSRRGASDQPGDII